MTIDRPVRSFLSRWLPAAVVSLLSAMTAVAAASDRTVTFEELGVHYPIRLQTVFGQASVPLPVRYDELVTAAELQLELAHSPSLRSDISHLTVLVNDEVVWTRPLDPRQAAGATHTVAIDPLLLLPQNQVRFELVAHYARDNECEDPTNTTLWATISNRSRLKLKTQVIEMPPTLDRLPAPWFDPAEQQRLVLPVIFDRQPSAPVMQAAGVVAAWFGAQADYRGVDFPVHLGSAPQGHALLFRVGSPVTEVRAVRNPDDPRGRLLVFTAPDEESLIQLAQAFAMGSLVLSGEQARLERVTVPPEQPRPWSDYPPLGQLPLQPLLITPATVSGVSPGPISFEFRLPPDLYFLGRSGGEIDLRYRASRAGNPKSALSVLLNDDYLGSALLNTDPARIADDGSRRLQVELPPQVLRGQNRLVAQFSFLRDTSKPCEDFRPDVLRGSIDPRSALSLGRHAHFAEMPSMERLAYGGFPHTRYADLSRTALVLPDRASTGDLSAALILIGHLGRWTQAPATHLRVETLSGLGAVSDRDLIVVAGSETLELPEQLTAGGVLGLQGDSVELRDTSEWSRLHAALRGRGGVRDAEQFAGRVLLSAGNRLGTLQQFRSPYARDRSVLLLATLSQGDPRAVALSLVDPGTAQFVEGGLVLVTEKQISGYQLGASYGVGSLPWWHSVRRWLSHHPYLLVPLAVFAAVLLGLLFTRLLRRRARHRVSGG